MNPLAEQYVKLSLALGQHDPLYVDAYYGPPEWKAEAESKPLSLVSIIEQGTSLQSELKDDPSPRARYLWQQLNSVITRARMKSGESFSFDEESKSLYDVVAPHRPDSFYSDTLKQLEPILPGSGSLADRYDAYRKQFVIPSDRVNKVFELAIDAARQQSKKYIELTDNETFRLEYVTGEVWSAYNWYEGNSCSLIQINLDLPITIDRAVGLACHEGYPGHHVYNALLERHLMREKGWIEFSLGPLYSSQALISEGTAEYGVELCFSPDERMAFERDELYPAAGLDPNLVESQHQVNRLMGNLGYASNDVARAYLDGERTKDETVEWLVKFALATPERAEQRIRFIEAHRSYVVTYNVGEDLVRDYVHRHASTTEQRWSVFAELLSTPQVPSNLLN